MTNNNHLYSNLETRLDTILGNVNDDRIKKYDFWKALKKANDDYLSIDIYGDGTFSEFVLYNYGIQLHFNSDGQIIANVDVVDEQKHLLFVLKYT
jgi:hypothetical protein